MNSIIQRLVEIDRQNALRVEEAKKAKDAVHVNLKEQKEELYNQYLQEQTKELEAKRQQAIVENQQLLTKLEEEYTYQLQEMEQTYNENKDTWVKELYNRCID
ncbi:V-type proton ATPase subunit G [Tannockella kyphosi]|uniref:hypothetical protein n=1 Tax=Tannockella kyphosi TaxID=2899121 RepID=UPI0020118F98|nr:hypothetical protein [Tannockella kyphosi]